MVNTYQSKKIPEFIHEDSSSPHLSAGVTTNGHSVTANTHGVTMGNNSTYNQIG